MATQITQTITPYPTSAPSLSQSQIDFTNAAVAKVAHDVTVVTQINTLAGQMNSVAIEAESNKNTAVTKAGEALNSAKQASNAATAATFAINATQWISGASYTVGQHVFSPITFMTYRAKTTHSGISTDPSNDSTRWLNLAITINNTLTSTSSTDALSAAQGKVLQDSKQATLVSGTNIKTVNGTSLLGSGDLPIAGGTGLTTLNLTGNYTMANTIERAINIASSTSEYNITLPAANNLGSKGVMFFIRNNTNYKFPVYNGNNEFIFYLAENTTCFLSCVDTSTVAGKWVFEQDAVTISSSTVLDSTNTISSPVYSKLLAIDTNKYIALYYSNTTLRIQAVVITVSGTSISVGAPTSITTTGGVYFIAETLTTNAVSFMYHDTTNNQTKMAILTVSGTTITVGSFILVTSGALAGSYFTMTILNSTSGVFALIDSASGYIFGRHFSVSGTTITLNGNFSTNTPQALGELIKLQAVSSSKVLFIRYALDNQANFISCYITVSGTALTKGADTYMYLYNYYSPSSSPISSCETLLLPLDHVAWVVRAASSISGGQAGFFVIVFNCSGASPVLVSTTSFPDNYNTPGAAITPYVDAIYFDGNIYVSVGTNREQNIYKLAYANGNVTFVRRTSTIRLTNGTDNYMGIKRYASSILASHAVNVSGAIRLSASILS